MECITGLREQPGSDPVGSLSHSTEYQRRRLLAEIHYSGLVAYNWQLLDDEEDDGASIIQNTTYQVVALTTPFVCQFKRCANYKGLALLTNNVHS